MKPNLTAKLLAIVTLAGCHFGDSPGYLGRLALEKSDATRLGDAGRSEPAADGGGSEPQAGEDGARVPPRLTVAIAALPGEVCPGECVMLLAHASGGAGDVAFDWLGDVRLRGAGPHRVCPTRDSSYLVVASDGNRRADASAIVRIGDYCEVEDDAGVTPPPDPGGATSEWRMLGYDPASTFFNRAERVLTKANVSNLREKFTLDLEGGMYGSPLLVGGRIYVNAGHYVRAHDLATGAEIWRLELGARQGDVTRNTLAYDAGLLYLWQQNAIAIALNAGDGSMVWMAEHATSETDLGMGSPIVVGDTVVLARSSDVEAVTRDGVRSRGSLIARQKRDGFLIWQRSPFDADRSGAGIASTPAVDLAAGSIFATTTAPLIGLPESLIAVGLDTGTPRFLSELAAEAARPGESLNGLERGANSVLYTLVDNGAPLDVVVAGTHACFVSAMRRETGEYLWTSEFGPGAGGVAPDVLPNAAWSGESVLVSCNEGPGRNTSRLVALEGRTGATIWERRFDGAALGRITVANGVGFVGAGAALEVFDVETGETLRSIPTGGSTAFSVASIANGIVAFAIGAQADGSAAGAKVLVYSVTP